MDNYDKKEAQEDGLGGLRPATLAMSNLATEYRR
jgi:hypothetical protein